MPSMWWFEVFEMVRKFLLVGGPILLRHIITDADKASIVYGLITTMLTAAVLSLGDPYLQKADERTMLLSQTCFFFALVAGTLVELVGPSANTVAATLVLGTAVPATVLMVFAVLFPRTNDRWMMRKRNRDLAYAIDALPHAVLPPSITAMDVAHAVSTMSERDVKTMLKNPGLEAALHAVFGDGGGPAGGSAVARSALQPNAMPKKVLL